MSIVIINHHSIISKDGSNHRHYKIGNSLSSKGIYYELVSSSLRQNTQEYIHNKKIKLEKINGNFNFISVRTKPKYKRNLLRFVNYLDFTLKVSQFNFEKPPEHIVGSSVHPFTWIAAYKLSKKYGSKFHIEIRDIWPLSLYEDLSGFKGKLIFKFFNMLEKKYYPLADSIIVTAPKANEYLEDHYNVNKDKIFYVPHSISLEQFHHNQIYKPYHKIDNDFKNKFNITYSGALSPSEGLTNLLHLAKELREYKQVMIHIFGGGAEEEFLKNIIQTEELDNVKMHGFVKGDFVPYILSKSDLLWVGLKERKAFKYGISKNKFYEYIAAKKPIIFHSNVKYSPLNEVDNAYLLNLNESAKSVVLQIMNGEVKQFDSENFLEKNHSNDIIAKKFLNALKYDNKHKSFR